MGNDNVNLWFHLNKKRSAIGWSPDRFTESLNSYSRKGGERAAGGAQVKFSDAEKQVEN